MDTPREAWNADYAMRGRRWARGHCRLPSFHPHERVLDAGCGDGKSLATIVGEREFPGGVGARCPEVVAFDFSREAIRICASRFSGNECVHLVSADASRMPYRAASFDAVLLFHILGHAAAGPRREICSEVERVIRRGGYVYLRVFSAADFRSGKGEEIEEMTFLRGDGTFTHYFSLAEIPALFPNLCLISIERVSWTLRVRGEHLPREEIHAVFRAGA
ncbi:MAG: hypothetical protein A4E37_01271 [Methanoregulaceae archaeon PtaB.Bin056]|nr:MAG: hypothetical protein A4E37_01271 [Methanoregulaceae archaeon PtaB.Bin056]